MLMAPKARYRLYTSARSYLSFLRDVITGRLHRGDAVGLLEQTIAESWNVGAQHLKNCADLDSFSEFYRDCPNAKATAQSVVLLPTYPRYGDSEVKKTAGAVVEFLDGQACGRFVGVTG